MECFELIMTRSDYNNRDNSDLSHYTKELIITNYDFYIVIIIIIIIYIITIII